MADSLTESNNILSSEINAENADSSHFWLYFFAVKSSFEIARSCLNGRSGCRINFRIAECDVG